jgi:predicted dehydrogenase
LIELDPARRPHDPNPIAGPTPASSDEAIRGAWRSRSARAGAVCLARPGRRGRHCGRPEGVEELLEEIPLRVGGVVDAAWDLAAHEIAIFNFLFNAGPVTASAAGRAYSGRRVEDLAFITLEYPGDLMAGIMASWLHPRKVRAISVVGDRRMATFDDLAPRPVVIHEGRAPLEPYSESYGEFQLLSRETEVTSPAIPPAEPLKEQARFFISAMDKGTATVASGERGSDVVLALEAISESMRRGGAPVAVAARPEPPAQP